MIYKNVFLEAQKKLEKDPDYAPPPNPTALLLVSHAVSIEAKKAFQDTWVRQVSFYLQIMTFTMLTILKIDTWKTNTRKSIERTITFARKTRATEVFDKKFRSISLFRHINISVQLEFCEDVSMVACSNTLLNAKGNRDHRINYDISLGYLDSHCCMHMLGRVFQQKTLGVIAMIGYVASLRNANTTVTLQYTRGCHCPRLETKSEGRFWAAMKQVEKSCKEHGLALTVEDGLPRNMPRWTVTDGTRGVHVSRADINDV